ncbi:MAG: carboxylase family protein [Sporolactobacillus laevolacticus]|jgi:NCAIR mutase (PurE)-related protein|nr:carboxylase family protein [Sporolactobacillus laevolacticus]
MSNSLKQLLEQIKNGELSIESGLDHLKTLPFEDLGYAKIDHHRKLRNGFPEVIYCEGKTIEQAQGIARSMIDAECNILGTRASREIYEGILQVTPHVTYYEAARCIVINPEKRITCPEHYIAVVTAGTSDIPVAEEAAVTAETFGNRVERIYDVGVAGIHRLFAKLDLIRGAWVVIVVAGMEGALASVVGGLVDRPVLAVPTSVGYGASFNGLAALLTMLNSCASGVSVVNIDNGFGAAYSASLMNRE